MRSVTPATTSTLLARAIFSEGERNVVVGTSAVGIKRGLQRGLDAAIGSLHDLSRPVKDRPDTEHVATVSAHNDPEIGRLRVPSTLASAASSGCAGRMDDPATIRMGPGARGHRSLPHTADVILQSWGPDVAACCEEAVAALAALYVDAPGGAIVETRTRHVRPDGAEAMLLELLEEVIFALDTAETVPVHAQVRDSADGGLDVVLELAARGSVEPTGAVPKAISRSGLKFDVDQRGARCSFLVDV